MTESKLKAGVRIEQLDDNELEKRNVKSWPIWAKEASRFDWTYDSQEECYFLEGAVTVQTPEGDLALKKGDFVTFPKGLSCVWEVSQPVKKHYRFSET